jgi:2,3-bisphosphoglycerate-dependent phosphoglycerate mutase
LITEIYLVRHADSDYSSGDEETRTLSERGRIDAASVAELLWHESIQVLCSSPYVRAIQTVEGFADRIGIPIDLDERFRERIFTDQSYISEDPMEAMERGFIEPDFALRGGESNRDVERRGITALNSIIRKYNGKRVAIGIHGGIMAIIMHYYDNQFGIEFLRKLAKPAIYKLTFRNEEYLGAEQIGDFRVQGRGNKGLYE